MNLHKLYSILLDRYNQQGWWPLLCDDHPPERFTCYHPDNYDIPRNNEQIFEICIGAILTQNTNWLNVERSLNNLKNNYLLSVNSILDINHTSLAQYIKSSGYFNQKARKLKEFCQYFKTLKGTPNRNDLLSIWGIGAETADSILLYAYKQPVMVIDAYTRRVFKSNNFNFYSESYEKLKKRCEENLPVDFKLFQEFHALLVEEGKSLKK